jgi:predicted acetylornithine/succinylornithine family transaminase
MGARYERIAALDAAFHLPTYARQPVLFERGEGMRLYDDDGREYLDFVSGIGAVNLGHAHPAVADAVARQMRTLVHVSNLYHVEHRAALAERLSGLAGGGWKAFLCNSLARRWGKAKRGGSCFEVVTAEGSFHGRTMAALSATGQPAKQDAFAPLLPGFTHVPLNDLDALEAAVSSDTCAVLLEPVQGEGGVHPCDEQYLRAVRSLCTERDILLIFDEVQSGCYRTGTPFAWQGYGVRPDVMMLAKSLANGLPVGAVLASGEAAEAFSPGDHGSTFGGGPVLCAAALATLDALEGERLGINAERTGSYMRDALEELGRRTGAFGEVRGRGLMLAAELVEPNAKTVASACLDRGIVVNAIGDTVLRLLPPLVCSNDETDTLLNTLEIVLEAV